MPKWVGEILSESKETLNSEVELKQIANLAFIGLILKSNVTDSCTVYMTTQETCEIAKARMG